MSRRPLHLRTTTAAAATLSAVALVGLGTFGSGLGSGGHAKPAVTAAPAVTSTPIKHVVVIFEENISFDHYFGTYPNATNTSGQPFYAAPGTPTVNGLTGSLLTANPNGVNPQRLDPSNVNDLLTCDQNHDYTPEQFAFDNGAMDRFTAAGGTATTTRNESDGPGLHGQRRHELLRRQHRHRHVELRPALRPERQLVRDDLRSVRPGRAQSGVGQYRWGRSRPQRARRPHRRRHRRATATGGYSLISRRPALLGRLLEPRRGRHDRHQRRRPAQRQGPELGLVRGWLHPQHALHRVARHRLDLQPARTSPAGPPAPQTHNVGAALGGTGQWGTKADYIPHHEPFQYYASTANPHHLAPASLSVVGTDTATPGQFNTANHQYDRRTSTAWWQPSRTGKLAPIHLPAVSFLKAPGYQDGHADYSDPIDEQKFVVNEINSLEALPTWSSTAVVIAYDDSDGWYDHVYSGVTNPSQTASDVLTGTGQCGTGTTYLFNEQGRCGYGPRLPLLVISPYAKSNFVSNTLTDQSSIIKFIDQNWSLGQIPGSAANIAGSLDGMFNFSPGAAKTPALILSPKTGQPTFPILGTLSPAQGPVSGGTSVKIKGINFSTQPGATIVRFGNLAALTCDVLVDHHLRGRHAEVVDRRSGRR